MAGLRIALDGPGSSGKSSVGAAAALRLGYRFLDTGVLYRAITLLSVERRVDVEDEAALVALVPELELIPDDEGRMRRIRVDGVDVTDRLHSPEVDRRVSAVSRLAGVRSALLMTQRSLAAEGHIIVAGRDIGTVVLPDADLKIYLEVSLQERARRRTEERGLATDGPERIAVLEDLRRRDHLDSTREVAPLRIPDDAVIIRSDGAAFDETVGNVVAAIEAVLASLPDAEDTVSPGRRLPLYPRVIAGLCRIALKSLARVRVEGLEHVPTEGPLIIAANHISMADPPLIGGWLAPRLGQRPMFLAKASLFVFPIAAILRSFGAAPVKTGGSDMGAYRAAKAVLDAGGIVAILPEGTRSFDGVLADPMPGVSLLATRTGTRVLPVGISGADAWLGRGRHFPRLGTRIDLRIGRPFGLTIPTDADRRTGLKAADVELMRRIAALVDERHRGAWQPWPEDVGD